MYSGVSEWNLLQVIQSASEDGQWDLVDKISRYSDFRPHDIPQKAIGNAYEAGQYAIAARLAKMKYSGIVILGSLYVGILGILAQQNQQA